jgi:hypothetical protein
VFQSQLLDARESVSGLRTVQEDNYAGVLRRLAQSLIVLLIQLGNLGLFHLLVQFLVYPLQDGKLLSDPVVLRILVDLFGARLVKTNSRISFNSEFVLQLLVLCLSDVDLGHSHASLELSAKQLPFAVEVHAGRTVGLIEVDDEGFPRFQECRVPIVSPQEESITLLSQFLLITPLLICSFLFLFLEFLKSLQIPRLLGSGVNERVKVGEHELDNAPGSKLSGKLNGSIPIISVERERGFLGRDRNHPEKAIEDVADLLDHT